LILGLLELTRDNRTEHLRTINVLERFNIYQEVILGTIYRSFPQTLKVLILLIDYCIIIVYLI